jgi:hypothetical protein
LKMRQFPSWPGLSRPSTSFLGKIQQVVDARDKLGHDEPDGIARFYCTTFESDSKAQSAALLITADHAALIRATSYAKRRGFGSTAASAVPHFCLMRFLKREPRSN